MKVGDLVIKTRGDRIYGNVGKIKEFQSGFNLPVVVVISLEGNKSYDCFEDDLLLYEDYKKIENWRNER
jgi:hypothetical protein